MGIPTSILQTISPFIELNKIPHIIFYGNSGSGKRYILNYFINKIYSKNDIVKRVFCIKNEVNMINQKKFDAVIREFSTEVTFVANSNNIVPTQKALKAYIENRFTGGGSNLFTNALTAGQIKLESRTISNTAGSNNPDAMATVSPNFEIRGSLGGGLAALNMFFSSRTERDDFNG